MNDQFPTTHARPLPRTLVLLAVLAIATVLLSASGCGRQTSSSMKLIEPDYSYIEAGLTLPRNPMTTGAARASASR